MEGRRGKRVEVLGWGWGRVWARVGVGNHCGGDSPTRRPRCVVCTCLCSRVGLCWCESSRRGLDTDEKERGLGTSAREGGRSRRGGERRALFVVGGWMDRCMYGWLRPPPGQDAARLERASSVSPGSGHDPGRCDPPSESATRLPRRSLGL